MLSMVSFAMQKLLSLIKDHLFFLLLFPLLELIDPKNIAMIYVKEWSAYVFL